MDEERIEAGHVTALMIAYRMLLTRLDRAGLVSEPDTISELEALAKAIRGDFPHIARGLGTLTRPMEPGWRPEVIQGGRRDP